MFSHKSNADSGKEAVFNWIPYYQAVADHKCSLTLQEAMTVPDLFVPGRVNLAADLGAGPGRDTLELLARGWHVVAVDNCQEGIAKLAELAAELNFSSRLKILEESFATAQWGTVDLVTANLSLPYCPTDLFCQMWQRIVLSLRQGGILSVNLFGERHGGGNLPFVNCFTRAQIEELLKPFEVIKLSEEETDGQWANGKPAHLHEYQIVACKRQTNKPWVWTLPPLSPTHPPACRVHPSDPSPDQAIRTLLYWHSAFRPHPLASMLEKCGKSCIACVQRFFR